MPVFAVVSRKEAKPPTADEPPRSPDLHVTACNCLAERMWMLPQTPEQFNFEIALKNIFKNIGIWAGKIHFGGRLSRLRGAHYG